MTINLIPIIILAIFYIFFFYRNISLKLKLKKKVKANNLIVNLSIVFSGLALLATIFHLLAGKWQVYLGVFFQSRLVFIIGTVLILIGVIFSIIASISLSTSWRVGIPANEKTTLIRSGIYQISRNPYFSSFILVFLGKFLIAPNAVVLLSIIVGGICFHLMILKEEKYLETMHGIEYLNYKKKVGRYFSL